MKQIKIGKKYVSRCGRYVFRVNSIISKGHYRTSCVKILDDNDRSGTTWYVGEETSHYLEGNWMCGESGKTSDLVKRYRKGKPVKQVEPETEDARLGALITQADVGREVVLRNGERGKIVTVNDAHVFYEHGSSTRSASRTGSWFLDRDINYTSSHMYDIVSYV